MIDESKQMLSEIVTKNFAVDKTKKFISELEKNEYVGYLLIKHKEGNSTDKPKINSII
jgi:hypothetical protein